MSLTNSTKILLLNWRLREFAIYLVIHFDSLQLGTIPSDLILFMLLRLHNA